MSQHGDLRTYHIPQIPGKSFYLYPRNVYEAKVFLDILASYDAFQLDNNIKPDYANAGGLNVFDANDDHDGPEGSWVDWYSETGADIDLYDDIDDLFLSEPKWEGLTPR